MDTPERNRNQIATPISKFEESPVFNFLNNLSPIKPVKSIHFTQTYSFASIPSVFTSPHVSSIRESRFLRRHLLSDPSKPEFASDNGVKVDTDGGTLDAVNNSNDDPKESFGTGISVVEPPASPFHECSKLTVEIARTLNYDCSSPTTLHTEDMRNKSLSEFAVTYVPLVQEMSGKFSINEIDPNKETTGCDWQNLMSDATDLLTFDSPGDPEAFTKAAGPSFRSSEFISNEMQNMQNFSEGSAGEYVGDGSVTEIPSTTQPEEGTQLEAQNVKPDSGMDVAQSEKTNNEMVSTLYRGMRRRCLVFEMVGGARRKQLDEASAVQEANGKHPSKEKQLVPYKNVNESSRCILPGIGLHLNALAASSKDCKVVKNEVNASGRQLVISPGSAVNLHSYITTQESTCKSLSETSRGGEIVPFGNSVRLMENVPGVVNNEEINQSSPRKKRRRSEPGESEACKRCNCKKSKCLKLYCECFAAGVYCVEPCACQDCFNKPIHEDTVLATRKQIESRNPLAFAPKVIRRTTDSLAETGDKTPASARHKRGCNCKKSGCLKKYCECYQGGVGCSVNCRCEGCKNAFGRKDGCTTTDGDTEEEETDAAALDRSWQNPDCAIPATPLSCFGRPPMQQLPFSLKNKPPPSSTIGMPNFFQEEMMPDILQGTNSGTKSSASPNSKRVSPPHCDSPSRRKLILQSIPSFPSLTPNP